MERHVPLRGFCRLHVARPPQGLRKGSPLRKAGKRSREFFPEITRDARKDHARCSRRRREFFPKKTRENFDILTRLIIWDFVRPVFLPPHAGKERERRGGKFLRNRVSGTRRGRKPHRCFRPRKAALRAASAAWRQDRLRARRDRPRPSAGNSVPVAPVPPRARPA